MEPLKVEKFATANRGNGLRAVTALRPGELLFRSDPLAYTVCKGSRGVVCDRCLLGCVWGALAHLSRELCGLLGASGGRRPRDSCWMGLHGQLGGAAPDARVPGGGSRLTGRPDTPLGCRSGAGEGARAQPLPRNLGCGGNGKAVGQT